MQKHGASASEYEDSFHPGSGFGRDLSRFRCAVADGASESAFSGEWAELLVQAFGRRELDVRSLGRQWRELVAARGELPWYLESKVAGGAFAAFVGLSIREDQFELFGGGKWTAIAVGDSCLFHVRNDALLVTGPISCSTAFDNSPFLVSSNAGPLRRAADHVEILSGMWEPRDEFFLASDALAQWIMSEHEAGRPPWQTLRDLESEASTTTFLAWVEDLRSNSLLHNDDTTLLGVEVR